jgi:hypothetical protein
VTVAEGRSEHRSREVLLSPAASTSLPMRAACLDGRGLARRQPPGASERPVTLQPRAHPTTRFTCALAATFASSAVVATAKG